MTNRFTHSEEGLEQTRTARKIVSGMFTSIGAHAPAQTLGNSLLRSVNLVGPAGRLEALVNEGAPSSPCAAVICHPHPNGGGTFHNKVVYHAMKALNAPEFGLQWPVLRFDFRGTGLSDGRHDGSAESEDVLAALRWIENEYNLPIVLVGFSFGAAMALEASCSRTTHAGTPTTPRAIAALGLPTHAEGRTYRYSFLSHCLLPKLFLSGDRDQYAPAAALSALAATTAEPKKLVLLPGADHFFSGQLHAMQNALASWCKDQLP